MSAVVTSIPCRRCGYNLYSLAETGLCPECGTPVAISIASEHLRYCDPGYLRSVRAGLVCFAAGMIGLVSIPLSGLLFSGYEIAEGLFVLPIGLVGIFLLFGTWKITTPDPVPHLDRPQRVVRRLARYLPIAAVAWVLLVFLMYFGGLRHGRLLGQFGLAIPFVPPATLIVHQLYFAALARRVPDFGVVRACRTVAIVVGSATVLFPIAIVVGIPILLPFIGIVLILGVLFHFLLVLGMIRILTDELALARQYRAAMG
jgi:hypothetical protein